MKKNVLIIIAVVIVVVVAIVVGDLLLQGLGENVTSAEDASQATVDIGIGLGGIATDLEDIEQGID